MKTNGMFCSISMFLLLFSSIAFADPHIFDVSSGKDVPFSEMMQAIQKANCTFIGDDIDNKDHQIAQLELISALHENKVDLAIGVEMFRSDSQYILDQWSADEISKKRFIEEFNANWSEWERYQRLFDYVRDNHLKLVSLNVSRDLLVQVELKGFASLLPSQLVSLEGVTCNVEPSYEEVMRRVRMYKGTNQQSFQHFCESKILGDNIMAKNLSRFHKENPDRFLIILAGNNHCWKHGIPSRLAQQQEGQMKTKVVLLEAPGNVNRNTVTAEEADYLWLDYGKSGWWRK